MTPPPGPSAAPAIAIILARAGSKGVPGKNVAEVGGRPCIAWTIDAAQGALTVGRTVVSTDDPKAAEVARSMGVEVIDRPAPLAGDTARVDEAAAHAVLTMRTVPERAALPVVILYANVPVRPAGLIDRAVHVMLQSGCDSVQSYSGVGKFHPWWTARLDERGVVSPWQGEVLNHGVYRRQDLPPAFIPDGGVLVVSRAALLGEIDGVEPGPHGFFGRDRRGIVSGGEVIDIDSPRDLIVADLILQKEYAKDAKVSQRAPS